MIFNHPLLERIMLLTESIGAYEQDEIISFQAKNLSFCHYTSAEVAIKIASSRQMWMRNARKQTDQKEIRHGESCLELFFSKSQECYRLNNILDSIDNRLFSSIKYFILNKSHVYRNDESFTISVGTHTQDENINGRQYMWENYGSHEGVAIIINKDLLFQLASQKDVNLSPVLYGSFIEFENKMKLFIDKFQKNINMLRDIPTEYIGRAIYNYLHFSVITTKHPNFRNEREWRFICTHPTPNSQKVTRARGEIGGIEEEIFTLNLDYILPISGEKFNINSFIDRIIIGPSEKQDSIYENIINTYSTITETDWKNKVFKSSLLR